MPARAARTGTRVPAHATFFQIDRILNIPTHKFLNKYQILKPPVLKISKDLELGTLVKQIPLNFEVPTTQAVKARRDRLELRDEA